MAKIQNMMSKDFTVVHNTFLRDKKCKYCTRGVLITMLQKPDDYNFRVRITEKGRFVDLLYQISDEPILKKDEDFDESNTGNLDSEKPNSENPYAVEPAADNPYDLTNTNKPTTDKLNTEETNTAHSPSPSKKSENKKSYAEAVTMTETEYQKLSEQHTSAFVDKCIEVLNNYKLSNGKRYKSDYHAILSWVIERVTKDYPQLDKPVKSAARSLLWNNPHTRTEKRKASQARQTFRFLKSLSI